MLLKQISNDMLMLKNDKQKSIIINKFITKISILTHNDVR